jgi:regulator of protease activity HflC (stomatin/prohibitin superfamily)
LALDEILTGRRAEIEAACLGRVQQQAAAYGLGIEATELNLLDIHPPTAVVPNYRQVADAMEEREQLINEAQVTYARELLSVVGEAAVRVLNGASERGTETPGATGIGNWKLDDEVWSRLTDERDGPPLLSGAAAARLAAAQQSRVKSIQAAEGDAARFQLLLAAFRDERVLTTFQLYWNAVEQALANSSLIILDPQAAGRKHFFLGNGEPFDPQLPAVPPPASNPAPTPTSKED